MLSRFQQKKITVSFSWFVRCDQSSGPWGDDHQFEVVQNFWPGSGSNDIRRPKEIQQSHFTCNMTKVQACSSFTANPTWSSTKVGCILHILNNWIRNGEDNPDYPDWLVLFRYRTVKIKIRRISLGFYCIHAIFLYIKQGSEEKKEFLPGIAQITSPPHLSNSDKLVHSFETPKTLSKCFRGTLKNRFP